MARETIALLLVFSGIAGACAPLPPVPQVQQTQPTFVQATAELNDAYPTAEAAGAGASQSVSGFSMDLVRAWREGKQVNAEVCFSLPDTSDWTIWDAHFEYGGTSVSEFSSAFVRGEESQGGVGARRCDQLSFYVPPDADLSASSLTVESVGAYPTAEEYCTVYMPKIQQTLIDRGTNITLDCPVIDGVPSLQIIAKPEDMSQEGAEQLVFNEEFYTVRGPWSFAVTFDQ